MESCHYKTVNHLRFIKIAGICIPAIFILSLLFFQNDHKTLKAISNIPENITNGDFILRRGKGFVSRSIINILNDKTGISHCGIIIKDTTIPCGYAVIHSVSSHVSDVNGIQKTSLVDFMKESVPGTNQIVRHKKNNPQVAINLSKNAEFYLEQKIDFDHWFNLKDHEKIFCSELLYLLCINNLNDTLYTQDEKSLYTFNVFFDTTRFQRVWPKKKPLISGL